MDDGLLVDVLDGGQDTLPELVFGSNSDVPEHDHKPRCRHGPPIKENSGKENATMPLYEANPVPVGASGNPSADDIVLPVPFVSQRPYKNLSWAACGAMVLKYNNVNVSLSDIASKMLGIDCSGMTPPCDTAVSPQDMYRAYGFTCQIVGAPLSPQSVKAWIAKMQPIQPYFQWRDGGNHTVLIVGYYANGDLLVYGPLRGMGRQTYRAVLYAYGRGTWQRTWYNIRNDSNVPLS
jgi:hypothetical protein